VDIESAVEAKATTDSVGTSVTTDAVAYEQSIGRNVTAILSVEAATPKTKEAALCVIHIKN
jgi:hypothetical protein